MARYKDHESVIIDKFNGLWARGDVDNTPLDHFSDCENIKFLGNSSFGTRDGIDISQDVALPLSNIKRIYNYPTQTGNTLIALIKNTTTGYGEIYHIVNSTTVYGPILSISEMTDFAFVPYAGRAYISPFTTFDVGGLNIEKGLEKEFLYIYTGDGTAARKAALSVAINLLSLGFIISQVTSTNLFSEQVLTGTDIFNEQIEEDIIIGPQSLQGFIDILNGENPENIVYNTNTLTLNTLIIANGLAGHTDAGLHIFAFVSETISGYLTAPYSNESFTTIANQSVSFGNIPTSGDPNVTKRHLVATKIITNFNGDLNGYQFFFVPDAIIKNNSDTFLNNISFFDADLLADASHLIDNFSEIPAGAALTLYRNRLCLFTTFNDISIGLISTPGEPEAISQIDGLIIVPPDGNPITNAQELRDILYVTKRSRTVSFTDTGDVPSSWPLVTIENALGTSVHGIATVLDSGSSSVDFLIICTYQGISLFNGKYTTPELSWKIEDYWRQLDRNDFRLIQIVNAPIQKEIYIILPTKKLLAGNYSNGFNPKGIRWAPWSYAIGVNTITIHNVDEIVLGADLV